MLCRTSPESTFGLAVLFELYFAFQRFSEHNRAYTNAVKINNLALTA
jgi:cytochrome c-type biogenesis protein CcmH/NrfG